MVSASHLLGQLRSSGNAAVVDSPPTETGLAFNGGSIGGPRPNATSSIDIITDGASNLDTSRAFPVVMGALNFTGS